MSDLHHEATLFLPPPMQPDILMQPKHGRTGFVILRCNPLSIHTKGLVACVQEVSMRRNGVYVEKFRLLGYEVVWTFTCERSVCLTSQEDFCSISIYVEALIIIVFCFGGGEVSHEPLKSHKSHKSIYRCFELPYGAVTITVSSPG